MDVFGNHYGLCCSPLPVVEEVYKRKLRDKRKHTFQSLRSSHAVPQLDSAAPQHLSVNLTNVHWHAVKPVAPIPSMATCVCVCVCVCGGGVKWLIHACHTPQPLIAFPWVCELKLINTGPGPTQRKKKKDESTTHSYYVLYVAELHCSTL